MKQNIKKHIKKIIQKHLTELLEFTDRTHITEQDKFALFMNIVRSGRYSDETLKEIHNILPSIVNEKCEDCKKYIPIDKDVCQSCVEWYNNINDLINENNSY